MHDLLATDADMYMSPIQFFNIYYVRGVVKRDVKEAYFLYIITWLSAS